jgi:hypothetical protein
MDLGDSGIAFDDNNKRYDIHTIRHIPTLSDTIRHYPTLSDTIPFRQGCGLIRTRPPLYLSTFRHPTNFDNRQRQPTATNEHEMDSYHVDGRVGDDDG